ncbi:MAG: hypothetical protein JNK87_20775 [Bryobacterales bacterium]|nr:hypothetical protein [Bryobacterales bacterium]
MTKERRAQMLTVFTLAGALGFVAYRTGALSGFDLSAKAPQADPTPQDAIYAMLDAGREGKVPAYLAAYTGQMADSLRKSAAEQGDAAFSAYLRESNAPIKGIALQEPQPLTDREVKLKVEYVFADRNEVQWMYLEREGKLWRISRVDAAERIKTLVPYGTPVR